MATRNKRSRSKPKLKKRLPIRGKSKGATGPARVDPETSFELRGWPAIAQFLGMPRSTVQRWGKEGMPVRREGRNVVANRDALNLWLQRSTGEAVGVHIATQDSNLIKELRASLFARKAEENS